MLPSSTSPALDAYAERTVQCAAHRLITVYGFPVQDREDIEQHLRMVVLEARFDATRAKRTTFIGDCIDHRVANLVRDRLRACRHPARVVQMEDTAGQGTAEAVARIPDHRAEGATGQTDLRHDVASVMARLTPRQQAVCALIGEHPPFVIARRLHCSHRVVDRDLADIREAFAAAGLAPGGKLPGKSEG